MKILQFHTLKVMKTRKAMMGKTKTSRYSSVIQYLTEDLNLMLFSLRERSLFIAREVVAEDFGGSVNVTCQYRFDMVNC